MKRLLLIVGILAFLPTGLQAQVAIPRSVEAGTIQEQIEDRPTPKPAKISEKMYRPVVVPEGMEQIRFTLNDILIEGVHAYQASRFESLYAPMRGKEVTLADMYVLADSIRRIYHEDGYVLTQVFLPEQDIRNGQVRIAVVEGYISRLRLDGEIPDNKMIHKMLEEITSARPFNSSILEDVMLRLNEIPGVSARAALEPLTKSEAEPGAVGLAVSVERTHYNGSVSVDNYASRYLGVWQTMARAEVYGLASGLDKLSFIGSSSVDPSRLFYGSLQYAIPVHHSGTTLFADGNISRTHPGFRLALLDIFSYARGVNIGISQPIFRSREQSLDIGSKFTLKTQRTDVLGQRFSEDRLRTLTLFSTYSAIDSWWGNNLVNVELVKGLDILNATETGSPLLSRAAGHSDFTKFTFSASRLQGITNKLNLLLAANGQITSASLLSSEQFGFGGAGFGRGYDSSEISGDEGYAASAELRWQAMDGQWNLQPFVFYDIGVVRNKLSGAASISAASAGAGLRVRWNIIQLDANIAWPLTYTPDTPKLGAENKDPRLNLSLSTSF